MKNKYSQCNLVMWCAVLWGAGLTAAGQTPSSSGNRFEGRGAVVYDRKTSLLWQRCSVGQQWSNGHCVGTAQTFTWFAARDLGADGWRLPTSEELRSLIDLERKARRSPPLINPVFSDTPLLLDAQGRPYFRIFWTSNQLSAGGGEYIDFEVDIGDKSPSMAHLLGDTKNRYFVRLVRSAPQTPETEPATPTKAVQPAPFTTANGRYVVQGNEVLDRRTGLIWQRCPSPNQTYREGLGCTGVFRTYSRKEILRLGGNDWRLPTLDELGTLLDQQRKAQGTDPYIDVSAFPEIPTSGLELFFTSTPYVGHYRDGTQPDWCVNFGTGVSTDCGDGYMVRLVRVRR